MDLTDVTPVIRWLGSLDNLGVVKAGIAGFACLLLVLERTPRGRALGLRSRQWIGVVLAVVAVSAYFHFGHLDHKAYYHRWEIFHYYLGSKYPKELGYERLYYCAAIADADNGNRETVRHRKFRDLTVDLLVPASRALQNPEYCLKHFTPARWETFKSDVAWFRKISGSTRWWNDMQGDHGYNPSPVWTLVGHQVASLSPPGDGFCKAVAAVDVTLNALMLLVLGWAFGWRTMLVAAVFWSTQEPSSFYWTGGSILRQDWLFLAVVAVSLARKGWFFWAGFALAWTALLRIFPSLLWMGPLVVIACYVWRKRVFPLAYRRLLLGGVLACALLVPSSMLVAGRDSYSEFVHHTLVHNRSPITNHMSLRTLLSATPEGRMKYAADNRRIDPMQPWQQMRRERFSRMQVVFWSINALVLAAFGYVCWRLRTIWIALALGLVLIPFLVDPTCYYYSVWILAAVLTKVYRRGELGLFGLAFVGQVVSEQSRFVDDKFAGLAALYVAFSVAMLWVFMRKPALCAARTTQATLASPDG